MDVGFKNFFPLFLLPHILIPLYYHAYLRTILKCSYTKLDHRQDLFTTYY